MASVNTIISITDNISRTLGSIQTAATKTKGALDDIGTSATGTEGQLNKFSFATFIANAEDAGKKISAIGRNMTLALTAPLVMLGKKLYDASTEHETAYVGMTKTVEGTAEQYEHLNQVALEISENTPMNYVDVMGTMQTGGNLGVQVDQMEAFARSYAALESATDKKIAGETGAELVADFLTIMEGGVDKIEPFGSSIVHLGNNFNATEDKILSMGKRIAAAAVLANFTTPQVLGMATAFNAVGIEAEAGGSAASKLIKQMQLSAEVGVKAQQAFGGEFANAVDFQNYLATLKKADVVAIAEDMGTTVEHVQSMADSWLSLEQFASVSGKTADQFVKDWKNNPAQGMMDFFYGLNKMDTSGVESTLAMLDKMGITEVRQSNLVAAMASKPELFAAALTAAVKGYEENTAMWAEFEKQTDTQAAQNQMLANKLDNSMADLGDNVVKAVQPALDKVNELLDAFNKLSEADQDKIVNTFMVFAVGGPIVWAIGGTIEKIAQISRGINSLITKFPTWKTKLSGFFNNPAFWGVAAGGAIALLVSYLTDLPTQTEQIISSLDGIKISIDQESLNKTKEDIASVQAMADLLAGGAVTQEMEKLSLSVQMGFGTSSMYNKALAYEAQKVQADVERITSTYAAQIYDAEQQIINASTDAERSAGLNLANSLKASMDAELVAARSGYTQTVSKLFNGMAVEISKQYPEMADKIERAAAQYDLLSAFWTMPDYETAGEKAVNAHNATIFEMAKNLGYLETVGWENVTSWESVDNWGNVSSTIKEKIEADLRDAYLGMNDNPVLANLFASILDNALLTENLDFTGLQGALDGVAKTLDFAQAAQKALDEGNANMYGQYLVLGLGQGVTDNAGLIAPSFTAVRDAALAALQAAFLMHSPSQLMAQQGVFIPMGLAQGILTGQSSVISAAIQVAQAGIRAAKAELGIASPSKVFEQLGIYTAEGYAMGVESGYTLVGRAVEGLFPDVDSHVWGLIDSFNGLELSDADMKSVRELAEKEVINRFTTPEIHVEFTAHNNINSKLDINEVMDEFGRAIEDALVASAEGVHI